MKIKSTISKKVCAVITTVCFTFTVVSNNLFASFNINTLNEQQQLFESKNSEQISSLFLDKYGKVSQSTNNFSSTVVVNIQDLHCDYSVQKNIYSIIKELDKNYKISKIYVEGGYGNIDLSLLDKINPKFKDTIIENLLKEAKITASEYYALKTDNEKKLCGAENKDVYLQNIERLKTIVNNKEKNSKYLASIEKEIDILKSKYLSNENKELSDVISNYEKGNISQDAYFKSLIEYSEKFKINTKNYKNMLSYLGLSGENDTINYDSLKKEIAKTINELKTNLNYEQFANISKLTNDFQNISEFKNVIDKYNEEYKKDILKDNNNLKTYIDLKEKATSFNPLELVKEEKNLVNVIRTFLSKNKTELEVAYLSDFEKYFKGYVSASLTPAQWNYFKVGIDKFKDLYSKYSVSDDVYKMQNQFAQLNKFYETNDYRNEIFVKNMNLPDIKSKNPSIENSNYEQMLANATEIVVLVSGGYHTAGINEILNEKNISHVTIMPNVASSNSVFSKEKYDNIAKLIEQQKIALPLMANATQKEQISNIVDILLSGENANGITVSMLAEQLNKMFAGEIVVKNEAQEGKLKFEYKDGNVVEIDIDDKISELAQEQDFSKGSIEKLNGDKLRNIVEEVSKATFNFGQEIFAPQIYQISKDACIFMVNNKWYIGDGVIWDIANSKYNGKKLDGVEPVVYEYMPGWMQAALLNKEGNNGPDFDLGDVAEQLKDKKLVLQDAFSFDAVPGRMLFSDEEIYLFKKGTAVLTVKIQNIKNIKITKETLYMETTDSSYEFEIVPEGKEGEYKKTYFYKEIDSLDIPLQDKEKYKEAIDTLDLIDHLDLLEIKTTPLAGKDLISKLDEWLSSNVTDISQTTVKGKDRKIITALKKQTGKIAREVITLVLTFAMILSMTACGLNADINEPTYPTEIQLTQENKDFNDQMLDYLDEFYVGNGQYRSFLYDKMPEFYKNNTVNKDTLRNIENLYDQSLVALSYMQMGQLEEADKVLGAINNSDYLYKSNMEYQQSTGEIVWVGIAAVQYKLLTGSTKYDGLITKVDDHLNRVRKYDGSYYGELVYSWISTEHMLDIVAYYNLKTLYDDSDEVKTRLEQAANYLYESLYNEQDGTFRRGFEDEHYVLDTCSWGTQVLLSLKAVNPEIYNNSSIKNIDVDDLLEYAEDNFKTKIHYEGKTYENLYKWSAESTSPVSFEWTMEMAVTYRMMGNDEKADAILKDVLDYSKALGIEEGYIAYADQNEVRNYFMAEDGGWLVYVVPAVCTTVGQRVQIEYGSFYMPMTKSSEFNYVIENDNYQSMSFAKMQGENWKVYSTSNSIDLSNAKNLTFQLKLVNYVPDAKVKIQLLPTRTSSGQNLEGTDFGLYEKVYTFDDNGELTIDLSMEDFEMETFGTTSQYSLKQMLMDLSHIKIIISAGETCFGEELNSTKLNIEIENIQIQYNDDTQINYKPLTFSQESEESSASSEEPSAILPETYRYINKLIHDGVFSIRKALMEILGNETVESLFNPVGFVNSHLQTKGAIILTTVTAVVLLFAFGVLSYMSLPMILAVIEAFISSVLANVATHLIIDYRYLKSSGLKEAINLYGNKNVSFNENGVQIKNKEKTVPIYVVNDKPKNVKEFDFKPVSVKFKNKNGKIVRGWLGNYKGAAVLFAEGVNYQDIAEQFSQTKQFQTLSGINANVDIIEVDLDNKDKEMSYSKNGNPLVGINLITTNETIDIQKEASLLNNKKVEAITINQNIAVYIDDAAETVSTSNDMLNAIDMYVDSEGLGTNAKILFTNSYIDQIIGLLEIELGSREAAQDKFVSMIKQLKDENKEISVVFEQVDKNTNLEKYFDYGIFTYIANGMYVDSITSTKSRIKVVSDLDKVEGFDGSLSVLKISAFKNEIAKTSGIFAFLNSSLNIKEIMEKRNIEFVKQVASNFDFNQIPNIDVEILANILTQYENKFTVLSKYLQDSDSISMYYKGLSNEKEQEAFANSILERMIVVNYLRSLEEDKAYYGLKDKNLENVLSRALVEKYKQQNTLEINSDASIDENLMASEVEIELSKRISQLAQRAFEQNDPQAIDDIIKLIPLYADRGTGFRTQEIKIMEIQNIKGILAAA